MPLANLGRGSVLEISDFIPRLNKFLVLTNTTYYKKSSLIICCGLVDHSKSSDFDLDIGFNRLFAAPGLIFTVALNNYQFDIIGSVDGEVIDAVLLRLIPLIGGEKFFR